VLDYHLHLWPHSRREVETTADQVRAYCERAAAAGVVEVALTEHLFRFTQATDLLGRFWEDQSPAALRPGMAAYWDHHARADLDTYVEVVQSVKAEGLPVVLGLEVDFYPGRMHDVAGLLAGYPFDVLLGSVHWLGAWRFDVLEEPEILAEWEARDIDAVWDEYTLAMEELAASGACDVFAHPDLVKVAGYLPVAPGEFYDRITEAALASGMAAELSSAGWRKPVAEEYPAPPLLKRLVERGVPLTTASDAHALPDVADRAGDLRHLLDAAGVNHLRAFRGRRAHDLALGPAGPRP
jgi:histidinol-phosphatase (PHP family)